MLWIRENCGAGSFIPRGSVTALRVRLLEGFTGDLSYIDKKGAVHLDVDRWSTPAMGEERNNR
jgi:hypothetical protein